MERAVAGSCKSIDVVMQQQPPEVAICSKHTSTSRIAVLFLQVLKKLEAIQAKRLKVQQQQQQGSKGHPPGTAASSAAAGAEVEAGAGSGDQGQEGGSTPATERVLSLREKKKLKAKAKIERRKDRRKEQKQNQQGEPGQQQQRQQQQPSPQPAGQVQGGQEQNGAPGAGKKPKGRNLKQDAQQRPGMTSLAASRKDARSARGARLDSQTGAGDGKGQGKRKREGSEDDAELERVLQAAAGEHQYVAAYAATLPSVLLLNCLILLNADLLHGVLVAFMAHVVL